MKNIDWVGTDKFIDRLKFPIRVDIFESYIEGLNRVLNNYVVFIKELIRNNKQIDDTLLDSILLTKSMIIKCVNLYHQGKSSEAYNVLIKAMNSLSHNISYDYLNEEETIYRMRVSSVTLFDSDEMFHIPFNMRYLVESQRYSIAGLPCLYLGSSHFICWHELNKPNFNELYVSSFKSVKKIKFLDISKDIQFIKNVNKTEDIISLLKFYPVAIACNFYPKKYKAKFNDEYIIPNILLQWVLKSKSVSGIKYSSVKYFNHKYKDRLINYVLPPKNFRNNKYCSKLLDLFAISKPSSFAILMHGPNLSDLIAFQDIQSTEAEEALLETYDTTIFGRTEKLTKRFPHLRITN